MISKDFAHRFAHEWIEAWNAHDLNWILSHYGDDVEMTTPFIINLMNEPTGVIKGKTLVNAYWAIALARIPDLRFELIEVFFSVDSICIHYQSMFNLRAVEWLQFNAEGKVVRTIAHYNG